MDGHGTQARLIHRMDTFLFWLRPEICRLKIIDIYKSTFCRKLAIVQFLVRLFLRPTIRLFCNLFKVRRHVIGCINHDIVIGLCSELLMRLSYYKMKSIAGIEPTPVWFSEQNASTLPTTPQALAFERQKYQFAGETEYIDRQCVVKW